MINKKTIAAYLFIIILLYFISPWFFERKFLFNELIAFAGICMLMHRRLKVNRDKITICISMLLAWGMIHMLVSLFRMDSLYYYLRNLVILYSVAAYFLGFYMYKYLPWFLNKIRLGLQYYFGVLLVAPISRLLFERFGMASLFPTLFKRGDRWWILPGLIVLNFIYSITYESLTSIFIVLFFSFLLVVRSYTLFKQIVILGLVCFAIVFTYLVPYLDLIKVNYSHYDYVGIRGVMASNRLLRIDGNTTWRLVLWKEILVDNFPVNIFGLGFGTPAMKYFPVEDYSKLSTLPYVIGAHNSFIYLFGRLGIIFAILIVPIYTKVFKEFFRQKSYYNASGDILIFYSFFSITIISLFNPTLESPIYASGYWYILGLLSHAISKRTRIENNSVSS